MAKTVIIEEFGGADNMKIVDREVGDPGPGQIRIRHEAWRDPSGRLALVLTVIPLLCIGAISAVTTVSARTASRMVP